MHRVEPVPITHAALFCSQCLRIQTKELRSCKVCGTEELARHTNILSATGAILDRILGASGLIKKATIGIIQEPQH